MSALLAMVIAWIPVQGASVVPPGHTTLTIGGGLAVANIYVMDVVLPVPSGELEVSHGLAGSIDVRLRYATHLGLLHRLGAEARVAAPVADGWYLGARAWTLASFVGSVDLQDDLDAGGKLATDWLAMITWRRADLAVSIELGVTTEWLLWEHFDGATHVDGVPYLAYALGAFSVEWPTSRSSTLFLRLEVAVPASPEPFTVLGVYPRILFGGSLEP